MIERRMLKNLDFILILTVAIIMVMSLVVIASATQANIGEGADPYYYVKRQGLVICAGLVALVVFLALDYHTLVQYANYIYAANLGLLLAVLALAKDVKGAGRWIDLGFFRLQPSEFAKIFLIITLANYLANTAGEMEKLSDLFPLLLHVAVPMLLIMLQPDLGTALVLLAILMGMMFVAGIKIQHLLTLVLAGVAALPFLWNFLKDYQKIRLLVFLDPSIDPTGSGYHVIQSMIAIGSGRLTGQGLLPVPRTSSIFSQSSIPTLFFLWSVKKWALWAQASSCCSTLSSSTGAFISPSMPGTCWGPFWRWGLSVCWFSRSWSMWG